MSRVRSCNVFWRTSLIHCYFQMLYLDEPVWVEPGYVLGYVSDGGVGGLAQLISTDQGLDYIMAGGNPTRATAEGRHLLQAVISSGSTASLFRQPPHIPGQMEV